MTSATKLLLAIAVFSGCACVFCLMLSFAGGWVAPAGRVIGTVLKFSILSLMLSVCGLLFVSLSKRW